MVAKPKFAPVALAALAPIAGFMLSAFADAELPLAAVPTETSVLPALQFDGADAGMVDDSVMASPPGSYVIDRSDAAPVFAGAGRASYYADKFHGRRTASGEVFDNGAMTAAHRSLPMGSRLKVTCAKTGKSVTVRVNDRGPYAHNRVIDLSKAAARELGMLNAGLTDVSIELLPSA